MGRQWLYDFGWRNYWRWAVIAGRGCCTKDVPPCEVWGGVPARKLKDRFKNIEDKINHLNFVEKICLS